MAAGPAMNNAWRVNGRGFAICQARAMIRRSTMSTARRRPEGEPPGSPLPPAVRSDNRRYVQLRQQGGFVPLSPRDRPRSRGCRFVGSHLLHVPPRLRHRRPTKRKPAAHQIFILIIVFVASVFTGMGVLVARFAGAMVATPRRLMVKRQPSSRPRHRSCRHQRTGCRHRRSHRSRSECLR